MSKAWKWILGILGVLIVVGLLAGAGLMWRSRGLFMAARAYEPGYFESPAFRDRPGTARGLDEYRRYHMDGWGGGHPMMGYGHGYSQYAFGPMGPHFMPLAGLFHMAFPLGVLALVAYVFYQLGKRAAVPAAPVAPPGPTSDVESPPKRKVAKR
jgi:hypothetical protein